MLVLKRVLSGMRPTGKLHLGHLVGALKNWVDFQDKYSCYYCIVDWHAMMSEYADPSKLKEYIVEMALDWYAVGIDFSKSTVFIQSEVPEHAELHLALSMITPVSWLERNPTYKEQMREIKNKDLSTYAFLGYPVLQAADILIYNAHYVPVGEDQAPHLELTREIARRFNYFYGEVFVIPEMILTPVPKILGTDGRKMSKSYNNYIGLTEDPGSVEEKVLTMMTDTRRMRRSDPGVPEDCPVFYLHKAFNDSVSELEEVYKGCRTALIGCIDCKKVLLKHLLPTLEPFRNRRNEYENKRDEIVEMLHEGAKKAREFASGMIHKVKEAMKIAW
ncbi:MAG: tryptophan--tRNA ligase [Synergistetes bacterium]|nr:tryptophan--tRNA ligase [Synergistota bacterium]MCX8127505.1 tryptophan--tRNA ligase [Synergistota bacterium]MDW8191579.1 tryptophan--tRNA ligase [Synergistota bacterium]